MIPSYANFGGKIHGGILLSLMDKVAYACASKRSGTYCVTVSVDKVEFLEPVDVGELVALHASVNYVGRTSLIVGIRVEAQNVKSGKIKHTNSSYFTMVAKGEDDKPTTVPALILENREQVKRFLESMRMKEIKQSVKAMMNDIKSQIEVDDAHHLLKKRTLHHIIPEQGEISIAGLKNPRKMIQGSKKNFFMEVNLCSFSPEWHSRYPVRRNLISLAVSD